MHYKDYTIMREESEKYFAGLNTIYCPAINEQINFLSEGFNHIIHQTRNHERDKNSQMMRFKLLPIAIKLIGHTNTYQEYECKTQKRTITWHKQKSIVERDVMYWGLIAIIDNRKIKVIIRKIANGKPHFWSVIPSWSTNKRDSKLFSMMKGNPDED